MNLAFLDVVTWDYDAGSPYDRPLGGSQSAVAYLAVALAARGHSVTLYTHTTAPRVYQGVQCRAITNVQPRELAAFGALIVVNGPADICLQLRQHLPPPAALILWTQHAHDQPAMARLAQSDVQAQWDVIVCVSKWHAAAMQRQFGLDPRRVAVQRNAIGPAFANLFPDAAALAAAKSSAPVLAYTSTPFRGLDVLLFLFPQLHRRDPRIGLRVYSSMKVYNRDESNDPHAHLYTQARSIPGVEYIGSLPQPALAASLKSATILSYPNTFAETSCISVMEAMAAGLLVVTTDYAALPETAMGMAVLAPGPPTAPDMPTFARNFADRLFAALDDYSRNPQAFWSARWEHVRTVTTQCTWQVRALEWEQFLMSRSIT
jgi:glycosyltransferase involved in cell wall biosynthesis